MMATETTTPPRGGTGAFVKKNKLLLGVAGGGALLYMMHKGHTSGSGTSGDSTDPTLPTTALVPVAPANEQAPDPITLDPGESVYDPRTGQTETAPTPPTPPDTSQPPSDSGTATKQDGATHEQGVTIAGRFFPGATGHHVVRSATDSRGTFVIHLIQYPGHQEWWHHYSSGQWTGPFTSAGNEGKGGSKSSTGTKSTHTETHGTSTRTTRDHASGPGAGAHGAPSAAHPSQVPTRTVTRNGKHVKEWHYNGNWHTVPPK